ncbi:sensor histidine kinase [Leifsonia shinshuensis]|uniref:sensor histidine kinase n=1 Tax=Leifsonia shinshuensis TaxID=150026 RepID=UPI001F514F86|nr:sensor histidine kinase [Leifsonia shinshuensis]MCI0158775.1 sensor histidine kinase [Leifsonia shinshuensis]
MTADTVQCAAAPRSAQDDDRYGRPAQTAESTWISRHPGPWFAVIWAPVLLIGPLVDAAIAGQAIRIISLVLVGALFSVAVFAPSLRLGSPARSRRVAEAAAAVLLVACTAYLFAWSTDRAFVFPLLAIAMAAAVRPRWALSVVSALTISGALAAGLQGDSLSAAMGLGFSTFFAGVAVYLVERLTGLVVLLDRTRAELATAAVAQERLRFSRDLHDLLGHTLSVIVVKAEVVRRMAGIDPAVAAEQASEIETVGRQALSEVREAVSGYRSVTLHEEIASAVHALRADGVDVEVSVPEMTPDARMDALLGWIVREGTTNVLRHSGATFCRIAMERGDESLRIEIVDNGGGSAGDRRPAGDGLPARGSGLRGLRERVQQLGGELTAAPTASGFRLAATIPAPGRRGPR